MKASKEILGGRFNFLKDFFANGLNKIVGGISKGFGNFVGMIQIRKGKILSYSKEEKNKIKNKLKPLDILFEKTPFRLTDKLIPGYYGHNAIWIGSKKELVSLGAWELLLGRIEQSEKSLASYETSIAAFQESYTNSDLDILLKIYEKETNYRETKEKLEKGPLLVEALRSGVELNKFESFLDIDDLGILRINNISKDEKAQLIIKALDNYGKEYDFNYDVETNDKIICAELIYTTFDNIQWPIFKSFGRYTISPDNVVRKLVDTNQVDVIELIVDGKMIKGDRIEIIRELVKE